MAYANHLAAGMGMSSTGDASGWRHGMSQPVAKVTDLSAHVDGGPASNRGTNTVADDDDKMTLYDAAIIVGLSVILLWVFGAFSFRAHNL